MLTAAQQHSLSSAVKVWEIQTEEDSLSFPLQAKTTSELDLISLASSLDGNNFWFASTVVWLLEA